MADPAKEDSDCLEVGPVMYWGLEAEASAGKTVQEVCQESKNWDEAIQEACQVASSVEK